MKPTILDVAYISDDRATIKAGCGDGVRWRVTSREEGERVAAELAVELRRVSDEHPVSVRGRRSPYESARVFDDDDPAGFDDHEAY